MDRLLEGNKRYMCDQLKHPNRCQKRREVIVSQQEPFAVIVCCADSRVVPEIIFDQGLGDLFVVRVAGNVIGPLELESIEFAVNQLHASVVLILGHENCGAVDAVVRGAVQEIPELAKYIEPTVKKVREKHPKNLLEASIQENARQMKECLLSTPHIQKKATVYAGFYRLQTGEVELL